MYLSFVQRSRCHLFCASLRSFLVSAICCPRILNIWVDEYTKGFFFFFFLAFLPTLLDHEVLVGKKGSYSVWSPQNLVQDDADSN